MEDNIRKLIMVEKNNYIVISDTFNIKDNDELREIKCKNKQTICSILNNTKKRLKRKKFFNWNIYNNTCKNFSKEMLITLKCYNKEIKNFIFVDNKLKSTIILNNAKKNLLNCLQLMNKLLYRYIRKPLYELYLI